LALNRKTGRSPNGQIALGSDELVSLGVAPVRRQYLQIKRRFPDTILLFRLGDFYETFEHDAEIAARVLDIVLTGRDLGKGARVPMAGIPHHAAESYIARLVAAGHKVAVCEQIGLPERGRGLIDRDVTRIVTPGTVTDPSMLDSRRNTFVASVLFDGHRCGIAYADVSTGEFATTQISATSAEDARQAAARELLRLSVVEVVFPEDEPTHDQAIPCEWLPDGIASSATERWRWRHDHAETTLLEHFDVASLDGFGLADKPLALRAAGGLLAYLSDLQRSPLQHIAAMRTYSVDGFMVLDLQARRNLELTESSRGERRYSLVSVLDETRTPMGARLLRRWLNQPLLDLPEIQRRQDAIQRLVDQPLPRAELRTILGKISDVERLGNRAVMHTIGPRELGALRQSLQAISDLVEKGRLPAPPAVLEALLQECKEVHSLLMRALPEDPPATVSEGSAIRSGFSAELDDHERLVREAREWIAGLERQERQRTGIRALKVGYNRISGYYIEISANALQAAEKERSNQPEAGPLPPDYVIRQSLANASRYVTAQLKEYEARILGAQETLAQLEADVFRRVVAEVAAHAKFLVHAAAAIAQLDVEAALAEVASTRGYVRPLVDESLTIEIANGRHPTLEWILPAGEFVANDALLDGNAHNITILTGPNMAGKSSWLRQVALVVLMAQVGSFVPATSAHIGLVDRIFTRVGAQDDISAGQSTFMVEMIETANILHNASNRSLVLLDEIGRGTSTWDGLAIARAVIEYLHNSPRLGCRTLFATHYHELTALADLLPGVCCARMDVLEEGDRVVFLHRVVPGAADRSYGIHVAEVAGVPRALTRRAREILAELERGPSAEAARDRKRVIGKPAPENLSMQLTFFAPPSPVLTAIRGLDVESLSPLEALTKLYELQRLAAKESSSET
jgi:DNA mismatch repair protein MutS